MRPIQPEEHRLLAKRQLTDAELARFNGFVERTALVQVLCQSLVVLAGVIESAVQTGRLTSA